VNAYWNTDNANFVVAVALLGALLAALGVIWAIERFLPPKTCQHEDDRHGG